MYTKLIKPTLDFTIALILGLVLLPLVVLIAICLSIYLRGTPFFFQKRPGKNGSIFTIIKFKTMADTRDKEGKLLPDADRLSGIGKLVRSVSLDEIPQLFNVIKGDMSLVGPRPLLPEYLPLYSDQQNRRHLVKPGITGWAQINGRNTISWDQKFDFDLWYVKNLSFALDLKIILLTVKKVLISEGISAEDHVSMPTFIEYMKEKNTTV